MLVVKYMYLFYLFIYMCICICVCTYIYIFLTNKIHHHIFSTTCYCAYILISHPITVDELSVFLRSVHSSPTSITPASLKCFLHMVFKTTYFPVFFFFVPCCSVLIFFIFPQHIFSLSKHRSNLWISSLSRLPC